MNRTSKVLKGLARERLLNNYGIAILAYLVLSIIISVVQAPFKDLFQSSFFRGFSLTELSTLEHFTPYINPVIITTYIIASILIMLASMILNAGLTNIFLSISRGKVSRLSMLFGQFKHRPDRFMIYGILLTLITASLTMVGPILLALCMIFSSSAPFIIASCIIALAGLVVALWISLRFMLSIYLLVDTDMSVLEAMRKSWSLMNGHCGRALYIAISFIGISLLGVLSFGLAFFWIIPYQLVTISMFYLDITGEIDATIEASNRMDEEMGPMMEY